MLTTDRIFPKLLQYMVFVNKGAQKERGLKYGAGGQA